MFRLEKSQRFESVPSGRLTGHLPQPATTIYNSI